MPISKASSSAVAPGAKGDLVVGNATNDSGVLAVGSTNQVLTVDSSTATGLKWAAASSGSMTLISSTALTGASTITISSIPTTGYKDLRLVLVNPAPTTDNAQIRCRPNNVSTTANYLTAYTALSGNGASSAGDDTLMYLCTGLDNVVIENLSILHIYNYAETTRKIMQLQFAGVNSATNTDFRYMFQTVFGIDTAPISSLTLICTGGNFNGGTAYVYGVN